MKASKLNFLGKERENESLLLIWKRDGCKWWLYTLNSYARLSFNKSKVLNEKGCPFMFKFPNIIMMYLIKLLKY